MRKLLLVLGLSMLRLQSYAQDNAKKEMPFGISIFLEEDHFNHEFDQDRNYTGGGAITLTGKFTNSNFLLVPFGRKKLDGLFHIDKLFNLALKKEPDILANSFVFGTTVFTPEDLATKEVVNGDRPYASLVFLTSKQTRVWGNEMAVTSELNIGAIGTPVGDSLQTWIHRYYINNQPSPTNRPIPQGWGNQISNGGEPTAMYKLSVKNNLLEVHSNDLNYNVIQVSSLAEANIGYYTNATAGLAFRIGLFNTRFWENGSNFGTSYSHLTNLYAFDGGNNQPSQVHQSLSLPDIINAITTNFDIYAFASGRGTGVLYNALLQGQFKKSAYTLSGNEINRLVYEFELGAAVRLWRFTFIWEPIAGRTSELNTSYTRTHIWGAGYFSYQMPIK